VAPGNLPTTYCPAILMGHLTWGRRVELLSPALGRWNLCNIGLFAPHLAGGPYDLGDLVLTAGPVVVRAPLLSLILRAPAPRAPSPGAHDTAAIIMQAMTSCFPVRGAVMAPETPIFVEHRTTVRRGTFDMPDHECLEPVGGPIMFLVELAGVLAIPPKGTK
jgi:hypothetical protein